MQLSTRFRSYRAFSLLLLAGAALARPAQAQVSAYGFSASSGTFTPLPAAATAVPALLTDDATSGATLLPLGFSFVFDGTPYTAVKASSNGFLSFNPSASYNVGNELGGVAGSTEKPLLAPLWGLVPNHRHGAQPRVHLRVAELEVELPGQWSGHFFPGETVRGLQPHRVRVPARNHGAHHRAELRRLHRPGRAGAHG